MTARSRLVGRTTPEPKLTVRVDAKRDHVQGPENAPVTLVEYGDYQCPYCGAAYPIVKEVQKAIGADLRFVFRNFPLTQAHPFAEVGAEIAEAAAVQGKFWEMHDALYENQARLSEPRWFLTLAADQLHLDSKRIDEEVSRDAYLARIREDFMSGVHSGVNGTPTFYINGARHDGTYEFEQLVGAVRAALPKSARKR